MPAKKKSATAMWMLAHPEDKRCPSDPASAKAWRRARGIGGSSEDKAHWLKYQQIMKEKREWQDKQAALAGKAD